MSLSQKKTFSQKLDSKESQESMNENPWNDAIEMKRLQMNLTKMSNCDYEGVFDEYVKIYSQQEEGIVNHIANPGVDKNGDMRSLVHIENGQSRFRIQVYPTANLSSFIEENLGGMLEYLKNSDFEHASGIYNLFGDKVTDLKNNFKLPKLLSLLTTLVTIPGIDFVWDIQTILTGNGVSVESVYG